MSALPEPSCAPAPPPPAVAVAPPPGRSAHTVRALQNGLKLGASLVGTWTVAMVVSFVLPRALGPAAYGGYRFAETLAATYMMALTLGVDVYVQRELAVRPEHGSDFFGGLALVRLLIALPVLGLLALSAGRAQLQAPGLAAAALVFGAAQVLVATNATLSSMLNAQGERVGGLAWANVLTKLAWGGGVAAGVVLGFSLPGFAAVFLAGEALRSALLYPLARRALGLRLRWDAGATRLLLVKTLPFAVNALALALCAKLDVTLLAFLSGDELEVGWYGVASNVAAVSMLLTPVLSGVVMPMLARARHESHARLMHVLRTALQGTLTATLPVTLLLALSADVLVPLAFGERFRPAVMSLRALAPVFLFTYVNILLSMGLGVLERGWALTGVSLVGVVVNPLLAWVCVPWVSARLGPGGAGVGTALSVVGMEAVVCALFFWRVGREALDAGTLLHVGKLVLACAATVTLHVALVGIGPWRLVLDALAWGASVVALGALRPRALLALAREVVGRRRAARA